MNVKKWIDGFLKKTTSAIGEGESEKVFDRYDITVEDDPHEQGWVSILANAAGRNALEELFPDLPIRWHRSPLFPFDWATADLFISRMVEISDVHKLPTSPPAAGGITKGSQIVRRLARGAMDCGCRVAVRTNQNYAVM